MSDVRVPATANTWSGSRRANRSMRAVAAVLAAAVLPLVATTSRPDRATAETPGPMPHIFDADADGLITNRRPANVAFLGVSDGVIRVEDSREATAGHDYGFEVEPDPNSLQQVINPASWTDGGAHSSEVVDTAVGFLTNWVSPDLVVLRGESGRWVDRGADPAPTSLTWYGQQRDGFESSFDIPLPDLLDDETPVGIEIVNNMYNTTRVGDRIDDSRYLMLATNRALYTWTLEGRTPDDVVVQPLHTERYDSQSDNLQILGIHHNPLWAASAAEQFELPDHQQSIVAVVFANTSQRWLRIDLVRLDLAAGFKFFRENFATEANAYPDYTHAAGADVRFSISHIPTSDGVVGRQGLRADVNLTLAVDDYEPRLASQYAARRNTDTRLSEGPRSEALRLYEVDPDRCSEGNTPTGFDVAYFRSATRMKNDDGDPGRWIEAHVVCAGRDGFDGGVDVDGYTERGVYWTPTDSPAPLPELVIPGPGQGLGGAVQPQVAVSFPCLEQLRYQLRLVNPSPIADSRPSNLLTSLRSDKEFMQETDNWRDTYKCSASPDPTKEATYTHFFAGNVQVTVSVPTIDPSTGISGEFASRAQATSLDLITRTLEVPALARHSSAKPPPPTWRPIGTRTTLPTSADEPLGMSPGVFLTRLPTADVVEQVRLTDDSATCARYPGIDEDTPGERVGDPDTNPCIPKLALGGPVPIAVMTAPPFVAGSGQESQLVPEFATGTSATQEASAFTSTSVGAELEVSGGLNYGNPNIVEVEVEVSAAVGYERTTESSTSQALTMAKITGYGGSLEVDTIVTNKVKYLEYVGTVVEDSVGINAGEDTVIRVPIENTVTSQSVSDLLTDPETARWWAGEGPFARGLKELRSHVPGVPSTYLGNESGDPDRDLGNYCLGDLDPEQGFREVRKGAPATANPFVSARRTVPSLPQILTGEWGVAQAGDHVTTQRSNIEFGAENAESFLESNTVSASVSFSNTTTAGGVSLGVRATVSAAGSWGNSYSSSLGRDTAFSGAVGSLPDPRLTSEQFEWRMFVCKKEVAPGVPVWVQGYQVRNYGGIYRDFPDDVAAPQDLGAVTAQSPRQSRSVDTTPELTWSQPVGTVKDYEVEVEAVGRFDARTFTAQPIDESGAALVDWPAVARRSATTSFTVPDDEALLPDQLYRWRVKSNNFFFRSERSGWEYFVTDGSGGSSPTTATLSGTVAEAGQSSTPVAGAQVRIFESGAKSPVRYVATDAGGTWSVAGLPPGNYQVMTVPPSWRHLRRWLGPNGDRPGATTLSVGPGEVRSGLLINLRARSLGHEQ